MEKLIEKVAIDIINSTYAIALTGAGISTESGIQDFRGPDGIWTKDQKAEANSYKTYDLFLTDPKTYWEELISIKRQPGVFYYTLMKAEPNSGHLALAELEQLGILKRVLTQNIDGLHDKAGNKRVISYHGNVNLLRCVYCNSRYQYHEISKEHLPPHCACGGLIKPDIVHFKEPIPGDVREESEIEAKRCDFMLICGTSAVVYPFANLPRIARMKQIGGAKIIEINAEPTPLTYEGISNCIIQGKTGQILPLLVAKIKELS